MDDKQTSSPGSDSPETKDIQLTQPKKGKPVEIPVPKRKDFERVLGRVVRGKRSDASK